VADVLQKYSNYDPAQCGFLCVNLNADSKFVDSLLGGPKPQLP
jgi:hypothetical protein